jgi:hypothetical protein
MKLNQCTPFTIPRVYGSDDVYRTRYERLCNLLDLAGTSGPPRPIKPCLDAIASSPCDEWLGNAVVPACDVPGQLPLASLCATGDQCQSRFCDLPGSGCGHCAAAPAVNQACVHGYCAPPLVCNPFGTCVVPGRTGTSCSTRDPCRYPLTCRAGTCAPRGASGASCAEDGDCDFDHAVVCVPARGRCISVTVGPSCQVNANNTGVVCSASGVCRLDSSCLAAAADDGLCADGGPLCVPPAFCVGGRCQWPQPDKNCGAKTSVRDPAGPHPFGGAMLDGRAQPARELWP